MFVIDKQSRPLQPCHPARARQLLNAGRAMVARHTPFVIRLRDGRTKWNRSRNRLPKTHTLDALCVGRMDTAIRVPARTLAVTATGRGSYQRTRTDRFGFPRLRLPRVKQVRGFATGDLVRAVVPTGKYTGMHVGRVAVRASGSFNLRTASGLVQGISRRYCRLLQRADGYGYTWKEERVSSPA